MTKPDWHKSTYSNGGSNCVEVREHEFGADVRDTQDRDGATLSLGASEWVAFLGGIDGL
ncbi:DUF397 domain-containing protein [Nocardiopsis mangrovi]|uniref:DUF397 domain-containing protein n=1 Tax=Nocardiopsis mangrovi TaxID=1179818 RepID=A0ABV9DU22_9ACTN